MGCHFAVTSLKVFRCGVAYVDSQGITFHWTLSTGSNLAESVNFTPRLSPLQEQAAAAAARAMRVQLDAGADMAAAETAAAAAAAIGAATAAAGAATAANGAVIAVHPAAAGSAAAAAIPSLASSTTAAAAASDVTLQVGADRAATGGQISGTMAQGPADTDAKVACAFGLPVTWLRYLKYAEECLAAAGEAREGLSGRACAKWEMLDVLAESWAGCGMGECMQPPVSVMDKLPTCREQLASSGTEL